MNTDFPVEELHRAKRALTECSDQLLREMIRASETNVVGRVQQYAPIFVNLSWASDMVDELIAQKSTQAKNTQVSGNKKGGQ